MKKSPNGCLWHAGRSQLPSLGWFRGESKPTSWNLLEYLLLFCKQVFSKYTCSIFPVTPHKCNELFSWHSCFQVQCLLTEYCKPFTESELLIGNYDQLLQQTDSSCSTWLIKKHKCCCLMCLIKTAQVPSIENLQWVAQRSFRPRLVSQIMGQMLLNKWVKSCILAGISQRAEALKLIKRIMDELSVLLWYAV